MNTTKKLMALLLAVLACLPVSKPFFYYSFLGLHKPHEWRD